MAQAIRGNFRALHSLSLRSIDCVPLICPIGLLPTEFYLRIIESAVRGLDVFQPGINERNTDSEKTARTTPQKPTEYEQSLLDKGQQERLMKELAQEYYQKMDVVASPVRCLTSRDKGFWERLIGSHDCISGHILEEPGSPDDPPTYYLIDPFGHRWEVVKDDSTKQFAWLAHRILPYDGTQDPQAEPPSTIWRQQLRQNLVKSRPKDRRIQ